MMDKDLQECRQKAAFIKEWKARHSGLLTSVLAATVLMLALVATILEQRALLHGTIGFLVLLGGPAVLYMVWCLATIYLPRRAYKSQKNDDL